MMRLHQLPHDVLHAEKATPRLCLPDNFLVCCKLQVPCWNGDGMEDPQLRTSCLQLAGAAGGWHRSSLLSTFGVAQPQHMNMCVHHNHVHQLNVLMDAVYKLLHSRLCAPLSACCQQSSYHAMIGNRVARAIYVKT
jgi:hypothetical protein